jgi:hypothetical protein
LALKEDLAAHDPAVGAQEIHDAERDGALAATRLAHDAEGFPALDVEAHPAHGRHVALARRVHDGQVAHGEDGHARAVICDHAFAPY